MSYITLSTGEVLQSEWDAKRVVASIVNGEKEGKTWMPLNDGSYYRISHIVSVTDERADLDFGDVFGAMFRHKGGDAK